MLDNFEMIDVVQKALENDGVLQNIRAQLRASVYGIIMKNPKHARPNLVKDFVNDYSEGLQVLSFVSDLLKVLNLNNTLDVLNAECGQDFIPRSQLIAEFNLTDVKIEPLLLQLIAVNIPPRSERGHHSNNPKSSLITPNNTEVALPIPPNHVEEEKEKEKEKEENEEEDEEEVEDEVENSISFDEEAESTLRRISSFNSNASGKLQPIKNMNNNNRNDDHETSFEDSNTMISPQKEFHSQDIITSPVGKKKNLVTAQADLLKKKDMTNEDVEDSFEESIQSSTAADSPMKLASVSEMGGKGNVSLPSLNSQPGRSEGTATTASRFHEDIEDMEPNDFDDEEEEESVQNSLPASPEKGFPLQANLTLKEVVTTREEDYDFRQKNTKIGIANGDKSQDSTAALADRRSRPGVSINAKVHTWDAAEELDAEDLDEEPLSNSTEASPVKSVTSDNGSRASTRLGNKISSVVKQRETDIDEDDDYDFSSKPATARIPAFPPVPGTSKDKSVSISSPSSDFSKERLEESGEGSPGSAGRDSIFRGSKRAIGGLRSAVQSSRDVNPVAEDQKEKLKLSLQVDTVEDFDDEEEVEESPVGSGGPYTTAASLLASLGDDSDENDGQMTPAAEDVPASMSVLNKSRNQEEEEDASKPSKGTHPKAAGAATTTTSSRRKEMDSEDEDGRDYAEDDFEDDEQESLVEEDMSVGDQEEESNEDNFQGWSDKSPARSPPPSKPSTATGGARSLFGQREGNNSLDAVGPRNVKQETVRAPLSPDSGDDSMSIGPEDEDESNDFLAEDETPTNEDSVSAFSVSDQEVNNSSILHDYDYTTSAMPPVRRFNR